MQYTAAAAQLVQCHEACMCFGVIDLGVMCFRVIDLGVMCPCEKILETAVKERAGNFPFVLGARAQHML